MKSIQLLASEVKLLQINLRRQYIYNRLQQNQMSLPSTSCILLQNDSIAQLRASVSSFDLEVPIENTQLQYTSAIDEEIDTVALSQDQQNMISPQLFGQQPQLLSNDSSTNDRFSIYFDVYRCPNQAFLSNIIDQLPKISKSKGDLTLGLKINRKKFKCTICHEAVQKSFSFVMQNLRYSIQSANINTISTAWKDGINTRIIAPYVENNQIMSSLSTAYDNFYCYFFYSLLCKLLAFSFSVYFLQFFSQNSFQDIVNLLKLFMN